MMANGYAGKILKVDLTTKSFEEIPTSKYEEWGGGHGIGSALFWDLCEDKTVLGDDPKNVVTVMGSPLSGTLAPAVAGRTEIQGIALQSWPRGWFSRSNFGGRFSTQLKFAGWDGIAITGQADGKYWLKIVDDKVSLEDATDLWGLDTFEVAKAIYKIMDADGDWQAFGSRDAGRTTQRPAVVANGPNAETFAPLAALVHDGGNGAGQGGFGGVLAIKGLKALAVLGTGGVEIADPQALMDARLWLQQYAFAGHSDNPTVGVGNWPLAANAGNAAAYMGQEVRPAGCVGGVQNCRSPATSGLMTP
jgi:aldehyde:ferredoxin oxidoreductase